ncbi:MAG: glycosyltransferase [Helicobacteraceae bacterium]|nr:glycosyltransferase [Helicobacteraceae bacterium]
MIINLVNKVTIMIPTYNQAFFIKETIDSALAQDYPNLEVIIADDCSTDNTCEIVKQYSFDSRIKYIQNKENLGRVENYRNTLYEHATGKYVLNLDGDDWLTETTFISQAVKFLEADKDIMCVMARVKIYQQENDNYKIAKVNSYHLPEVLTAKEYLYLYSRGKAVFAHMSTLYRREEALSIKFYFHDIAWTDMESIFRLICNKKLAFINSYVGCWRDHGVNETYKFYKNVKIEKLCFAEENIANFYLQNGYTNAEVDEWLGEWKYRRYLNFLIFSLKRSDFKRLKEILQFIMHDKTLCSICTYIRLLKDMLVKLISMRGKQI